MAAARALFTGENPGEIQVLQQMLGFCGTDGNTSQQIDEKRSLPYKPRQLSVVSGSAGAAHFGPQTASIWAGSHNGPSSHLMTTGRLPATGRLPGQRRKNP